MILINELKKYSWYVGFHEYAIVAQWNGEVFETIVGGIKEPIQHIIHNPLGFEPCIEIAELPKSLSNGNIVKQEITRINEIALQCIK